jgi:hypothetical protein
VHDVAEPDHHHFWLMRCGSGPNTDMQHEKDDKESHQFKQFLFIFPIQIEARFVINRR